MHRADQLIAFLREKRFKKQMRKELYSDLIIKNSFLLQQEIKQPVKAPSKKKDKDKSAQKP